MMISTQIFSDCTVPAKAGAVLTVSVTQSLDGRLTVNAPKNPQVVIDGPRFQLTPADVAGVYPAPGSEESADEFLPHIALKRRTLPWERTGPHSQWFSWPWLAVVLLKESELRDGENLDETASNTVIATTLGGVKTQDQAAYTAITATGGVNDQTPLTVVYIKNSLWLAIRPELTDLKYLNHIRRATYTFMGKPPLHADSAIVVSNRLPYAGEPESEPEIHTALLISLEGRNDLYSGNNRPADGKVALVVLHHWSFRPSTGGDFETVIRSIRYRPNGGVLRFGNLPAPPPEGSPVPLSGGYDALLDTNGLFRDPLPHTQDGEITWRGPLRPFAPAPRSNGFAIRPVPEEWDNAPQGTPPDYSHATAFEIGRLLAISNCGVLEDMRKIRGRIEVPEIPVAINKLPAALQKPDWVVDPALDNWHDQPWDFGAQSMIKDESVFLQEGIGDVSNIDIGQWGGQVLIDIASLPVANQGAPVLIDLNTMNGDVLGKIMPDVEIAGMS